jgi:solute carrier family 34 (sodium-dependent phosphate cotransporter)
MVRSRAWNNAFQILKGFAVVACLYLFLVGIKGIGASFGMFGADLAQRILVATSNPITCLFIGILSTTLVQSSSTTTAIIVGMVAGGGIPITGAVAMIMGANVGTSVTNTIVSLGHITHTNEFRRAFAASTVHDFFNILSLVVLFPVELATGLLSRTSVLMAELFQDVGGLKFSDPLKLVVDPAVRLLETLSGGNAWLMALFSVGLTFSMLFNIVRLLRSVVIERVEAFFDTYIFATPLRGFLFGTVLTIAVQSSSVTTSLVVPLVGAGVLTLIQVFPYTLGANIGTTITANLAALATGSPAAITVAFAHLLFNVIGVLIIWPWAPIRHIPIRLANALAETAARNRLIPVVYVVTVFYLLPLAVIILEGGFRA